MPAGGQVDVVSGKFMMGAWEGHLIENGKITGPVKKATISGTGIEALKSIDTVADDLTWVYNYGDVNYGSPTISLSSIKISGSGS